MQGKEPDTTRTRPDQAQAQAPRARPLPLPAFAPCPCSPCSLAQPGHRAALEHDKYKNNRGPWPGRALSRVKQRKSQVSVTLLGLAMAMASGSSSGSVSPAAVLVLLCPDHTQRNALQQPRPGTGSSKSCYQKQRLVVEPWFFRLCQAHGLESLLRHETREEIVAQEMEAAALAGKPWQTGIASAQAMVRIAGKTACQGPLTAWTPEERHYKREILFEDGEACCSYRILSSFNFSSPLDVEALWRHRFDFWRAGSVPVREVENSSRGEGADSIAKKLGVCQLEFEDFLRKPFCLRVPLVPLAFILKGAWSHLVLRGRVFAARWAYEADAKCFQQLLSFPSDAWVALHAGRKLAAPAALPALTFQAQNAEALAHFIRTWAPAILERAGPDQSSELSLFLEEHVLRLDDMVEKAQRQWERSMGFAQPSAADAESLFGNLCAAMHLRNRGKLAETLSLALNTSRQAAEDQPHTYSAATLSKSQLLADCALSAVWADFFRKDHLGPIYLWADSSPQGGFDWFLSMARIIRADRLQEAVHAAAELASTAKELHDAASEDDPLRLQDIVEQRQALGLFLKKNLMIHRQIPMVLGSGAGDLIQKLSCLARKILAESHSMAVCQKIFAAIRGFCTDLGTESGLAAASGVSMHDVLPEWARESLQIEELEGEEAWEAEAEPQLFPNALPSPGLLHIFHNMCSEMHTKLSGWPDWLPKFKALAALLSNKALRQKYAAKCIHGTPWAWLARMLEKGVQKPALWRWGTVQTIIPRPWKDSSKTHGTSASFTGAARRRTQLRMQARLQKQRPRTEKVRTQLRRSTLTSAPISSQQLLLLRAFGFTQQCVPVCMGWCTSCLPGARVAIVTRGPATRAPTPTASQETTQTQAPAQAPAQIALA